MPTIRRERCPRCLDAVTVSLIKLGEERPLPGETRMAPVRRTMKALHDEGVVVARTH
jgi:hypothetical protein